MTTRYTTIIPRMRTRAWYGTLPVDVPTHRVVTVEEALTTRFKGEALMTPYAPTNGDEHMPRLAKASLAYWAARPKEPMPTVGVVPVDIDHANHTTPPDDWHERIVARVQDPHGWYRTPHGLRLIFYPREPVRLDVANDYIRQLHDRLDAWGIETDPVTRTWYRLQMLPLVLGRPELPSDYSQLRPLDWHPSQLTADPPNAIGPIVDRTQPADVTRRLTKSYLAALSDRCLREDIYAGRLSAPVGHRHATLLKAAGTIVREYDTEDPLVPYELLYESAQNMGKPTDELWRLCEWAAAQHSGAKIERRESREDLVTTSAESMQISPSRVANRLIIDTGQERFVWDEERQEYSTGYTQTNQLLGALKRHCPELAAAPLAFDWPTPQILKYHSVVADEVVYTYGDEHRGYDQTTYKFYQPVARRDKRIRPVYHGEVHEWLCELFGDHANHGLNWLASVPELMRPTCGLYIQGKASIGKQLLALGIARLWSPESRTTPYMELLNEFNAGLKYSPLIWADEKVPQDAFKNNDSSVFRQIVGNTSIRIRDLYRSPAVLDGYPRLLITANNEDALAIREDLDQQDIEAIQMRIGYIDANASAADMLARLGGREYTEAWVKGGALAEHTLWLHENREYEPGDRFLVEGWESPLTQSIATRVGSAGVIGEVIAHAIASSTRSDAVRWYKGSVYVNAQSLQANWSTVYRREDRAPSSNSMLKALRTLSKGQQSRLTAMYSDARPRYWRIDAEIIAEIADRRGVTDPSEIRNAANRPEEPTPTVASGRMPKVP